MSAKTDYVRTKTTALKAQIATKQAALGSLLSSVAQAESLLAARDALGETPVRENIEAKYTALKSGVDTVNGLSLTVDSLADFMDGYDAAV